MAVFTITTFSIFAGLLLAAQKLATDPNPLNRVKALADLATSGKALAAVLRDIGLAPLADEMARQAEEYARHFTHPGPARDDAIAVFWQVAPAAFTDPEAFTGGDLDPDHVTERMVAAIKASSHARDFAATGLAEPFFRSVTRETLTVMLAKSDFVATITPELWRETLRRHGVQIELLVAIKDNTAEIKDHTAETLAVVRELQANKATTVPEITLIAMARKISPRVANRDDALRQLDAAADLAAEVQARGETGSNVDAFVDGVLRRLATLTMEGRLDEAASASDAAVDRAEAGLTQLLDAAINQHLLAFDAEGAARQIVRRITLGTQNPQALFVEIRRAQVDWYERGRDRGLRLDLEVAVALARQCCVHARGADQRGASLNSLGTALTTLGEWENGTARLEEAVAVCCAALQECTRERVPRAWAGTQANLGVALSTLGQRSTGPARLEKAAKAFQNALEVWTLEREPLHWASAQNGLGVAFRQLGFREKGTSRLRDAVAAYRLALDGWTRTRAPLLWAGTQNNIGDALTEWGIREGSSARLQEAIVAFDEALKEWTRELTPPDWAMLQHNLGNARRALGEFEDSIVDLEQAVDAYDAALLEQTKERVPLQWAMSTGNQGIALRILADRTSDLAMARRALDQIVAATTVSREGEDALNAAHYAEQIPAAEALIARLTAR